MAKIIISVGHTPADPGAKTDDLTEFSLASKIATEATAFLKSESYDVYTVPFDLNLAETVDWINKSSLTNTNNDVCIDIHVNDGGGTGVEGWHKDRGENKSYKLTKSIVENIAKETGLPSLGAKSEFDHPFKSLAFVHNTTCVSALIECGFIDSSADAALLCTEEGIRKFAKGVVDGIKEFLANISSETVQKAQQVTQPIKTQLPTGAPVFSQNGMLGFGDTGANIPVGAFGGYGGTGGERRNMVKRLYNEILGREADTKGLTYYLYINPVSTEEQIRKEMAQSTEHVEMVKRANEAKANAKRIAELEEEISLVRVNLESRENELNNFQKLLQLKNQELVKVKTSQEKYSPANEMNLATAKPANFPGNYAKNIETDIVKTSQPRGCLGFVRDLLGI